MDAVFKHVKGVSKIGSGYAGEDSMNARYMQENFHMSTFPDDAIKEISDQYTSQAQFGYGHGYPRVDSQE